MSYKHTAANATGYGKIYGFNKELYKPATAA